MQERYRARTSDYRHSFVLAPRRRIGAQAVRAGNVVRAAVFRGEVVDHPHCVGRKQVLGMRRRHVTRVRMQPHLFAAGAGRVRRKSGEDKISAEKFTHHAHHVDVLNDLLKPLTLVDEIEYALITTFRFEERYAVRALFMIEAIEVAADAREQFAGNEIRHHANAVALNGINDLIDIASHRALPKSSESIRPLNDRLIVRYDAGEGNRASLSLSH